MAVQPPPILSGETMEIVGSPNTRSRAAHYVRMSTEHQQYSPENKADIIRQYAANHNMEIVRVYSDHERSGLNIAGREPEPAYGRC